MRPPYQRMLAAIALLAAASSSAAAQAPSTQPEPAQVAQPQVTPAASAQPAAGAGQPPYVYPSLLAPELETVPPPTAFKTSAEHYEFLKRVHNGGTKHTDDSVPKWAGLWQASWNSLARYDRSPFFVGKPPMGLKSGGEVRRGVLSPEYERAFIQRRENMKKYDEQPYDRLTTCEAAGMPRWLTEPYVREFVNTPGQSWWLNDLANDTRRIYIGQDHVNIETTHFPEGDSVGFWAGDHLIVHTVDVWPEDYFRGYPPTSNQFEAVEIWHRTTLANGEDRLIAQVTFYDPIGLAKPLSGVYTFTKATAQEAGGLRIRWWECSSNMNTSLTAEGTTRLAVPGDTDFVDVRGASPARRNPDLPPDLPGQALDPDDEGVLSLDAALGAAPEPVTSAGAPAPAAPPSTAPAASAPAAAAPGAPAPAAQ